MRKFFAPVIVISFLLSIFSQHTKTMPPPPDMPNMPMPVKKAAQKKPVMPMPAMPKQEPVKGPETKKFSPTEIGTQGNWRKKKDWLKQAIEKNDAIQAMVTDVQKFKKTFQDKFQPVDEIIDEFYQKAGFDKGQLEGLINELDEYIKKTKEKTKKLFTKALSELDEQTQDEAAKIQDQYADTHTIEEEFKKYKSDLNKFSLDMKAITDLDASLRKRLDTANDQIDAIKTKIDEANKLSEEIWSVIDDKKAKKIFYDLSGIYETTKSLKQYITRDLAQDFDKVIATLKTQIKTVSAGIDALESRGLFVKNRANRLEEERKKQEDALREEQRKQREKKKRERSKRKRKAPETWYGLIWDGLTSFFSLIFSWFS